MTLKQEFGVETLSAADAGLVRCAMRRGATRRELLGLLTAGGMALTTAGGVLGTARRALAEEPRRGGRIRVAVPAVSTADTVDPAKQSFAADYVRCNMFYNGLFSLDGSLTPQLALAESAHNEDAKLWTLQLRKGVQFHDGKTLDAEDVVYSLNRHKDPAAGSKARALAEQMAEVKATGPHRGADHADGAQCRLARRARHLPLPNHQGRHDRLLQGERHRPVQVQGVHARRAHHRRAQRELLEAGQAISG